jgi:hypothetical protein
VQPLERAAGPRIAGADAGEQPDPADEQVDDVEGRRAGPVQVVQQQDSRADRGFDVGGHTGRVAVDHRPPQGPFEGEVIEPIDGGQRAALEHGATGLFGGSPQDGGLADSRFADDYNGDIVGDQLTETGELRPASDRHAVIFARRDLRSRRSSAAGDLAGLQAGGADLDPAPVAGGHERAHRLDVGIPPAVGTAVRVGHGHAEARPLAADVADAGHCGTPRKAGSHWK